MSWKILHVCLRRMCFLLLLGRIFCICLLGPSVCSVVQVFCVVVVSITKTGGTEVSYITVLQPIFPFISLSVYLMYLWGLMLDACTFIIAVSSWWKYPLIIITSFVSCDSFCLIVCCVCYNKPPLLSLGSCLNGLSFLILLFLACLCH